MKHEMISCLMDFRPTGKAGEVTRLIHQTCLMDGMSHETLNMETDRKPLMILRFGGSRLICNYI